VICTIAKCDRLVTLETTYIYYRSKNSPLYIIIFWPLLSTVSLKHGHSKLARHTR